MRRTIPAVLLLLSVGMLGAQQMNGTYYIKKTGGDYNSFVAAAADLRSRGMSGNVVFKAWTGVYNDGQIDLSSITTGSYTITFQPDTGQIVTVGNGTGSYIFYATNTSNVKIRDLNLTGTSSYAVWIGDYCDGWRVDHCVIRSPIGLAVRYYCDYDSITRCDIRVTSSYGIYVYGTSGTYSLNCYLANNFITGWSTYGIYLRYQNYPRLYHNTIANFSTSANYCVYDYYTNYADVRNNIFLNLYGSTSAVGWYKNSGSSLSSNYNCFWMPNNTSGYVGYHSSYGWLTWTNWRAYGYDNNGINVNPQVGGAYNLHLRTGSPCVNAGTDAGVPVDIDGDARSGPDIGADEYTTVAAPMSGVYSIKQDGTGDYRSFEAALSDFGLRGQSANVAFEVYAGMYNEWLDFRVWTPSPYWLTFRAHRTLDAIDEVILNAGGTPYGVYLTDASRVRFQDLQVTNFTSYGFYLTANTSVSPYRGCDTCVVSGCRITGPNGIYVYYGCDGDSLLGNRIEVTSSYGIYAYGSSGGYSRRNVIANNFVSGATSYNIYIRYQDYLRLYHNTVANFSSSVSYCVYEYYTNYTDLRNNIIINYYNSSSATAYYQNGSTGLTANYNCYYVPNNTNGYVAYYSGSYYNWSGWRGLGFDANGQNADPRIGGVLNLHLRTVSPCINAGTDVGIAVDIDGDPRVSPDIGADEYTTVGAPMSGVYTIKQAGGGDYASFAQAFADLQVRGWGGNVQFDVYAGTYPGQLSLQGIGNGAYRLILRGYPGENPVLDAAGASYGVYLYDNQRIHIEGFRIQDFTSYGVYASSYSSTVNTTDSCAIVGNTITGPNGIYWYYGDDDTIARNTIRATSSYGMHIYGYSSAPYSRGNVIANNMLSGWTSQGIYLRYNESPRIIYNTIVGTGSYALQNYYCYNAVLRNNILVANSYAYRHYYGDACPLASDYNDFRLNSGGTSVIYQYPTWGALTLAAWQTNTRRDSHSLSVDPALVSNSDLHLLPASPCINAGREFSGIATDLDGDPRNPPVDIGADEFYTDVAARAVLAPVGRYLPGEVVTPRAAFKHVAGYGSATYLVKLVIDRAGTPVYADSMSKTTAAGDSFVQSFTAWTANPPDANYHVTAFTRLANDQVPENDTARGSFVVGRDDAGVTAIAAPTGTVLESTLVNPRVRVKNFGHFIAACTVQVTIDDGAFFKARGGVRAQRVAAPNQSAAGTDAVVYDRMALVVLAPGAESPYTFGEAWTAAPDGDYLIRARTGLPGDLDPANDTLSGTCRVECYDVATSAIISPPPVTGPGPVTPAALLHNYGSSREPAMVTFTINALSPYVEQVLLSAGLPLAADTLVEFPSWTATTGVYTACCSVYTAIDQRPGNNVVTTPFEVGVVDAAVLSITEPTGRCDSSDEIAPRAVIKSYSDFPAMVKAFFRIDDRTDGTVYAESLTVENLGSGAETTLVFSTWPRPHNIGGYDTRCSTYLAGDGNHANDVVRDSFEITFAPPETGWTRKADIPLGAKSKKVKDGGALACLEPGDSAYVYAFKGNNRFEFYRFNTTDNAWVTKESIPAIGRAGKKKAVKKGSALAGLGSIVYGAKGNNSLEFWAYDPSDTTGYVWKQLADVPTGAKTLREGTGVVTLKIRDTAWAYLLKGSGTTEHYRYNITDNTWESRASAPTGTSGKTYKNGSALAVSDDYTTIYALKGSYNEFFTYSVDSDAWTSKASLPLVGKLGKKKKVKDGAGLAYHDGNVYALKGGNTMEFWKYQGDSDKWVQMPDIPLGTGKNVKGGGALAFGRSPHPALYALKGNNTFDFFKYGFGVMTNDQAPMTNAGAAAQAQAPSASFALRIAPNPFSTVSTISYSLPHAGNISLKLYDITGKLVTILNEGRRPAGSSSFSIHRSALSSGIYLLKLATDAGTTTAKLIVE